MEPTPFFEWLKGPDALGVAPHFFAAHPDGTRDRETYGGYGDAPAIARAHFWAAPQRIEMSQGWGHPPRFPDLANWSGDGSPHARCLLVSLMLHALLTQFKLPAHRAYDVQARFPAYHHARFGDQRAEYRLMRWLGDGQWLDSLDLARAALRITVRLQKDRPLYHRVFAAGSFETATQVAQAATEFEKALPRTPGYVAPGRALEHGAHVMAEAFQPTGVSRHGRAVLDMASAHWPVHLQPLDLLWLPDESAPLVSDDLRQALASGGFTGMRFGKEWRSAFAQPAEMHGPAFRAQRAALLSRITASPDADPSARSARIFAALQARQQALTEQPIDVAQLVLPAAYAELLRTGVPTYVEPDDGDESDEDHDDGDLGRQDPRQWHWFPRERLRMLDDIGDDGDWVASHPEAVRALLVAQDDGGDYLGFLLQDGSDLELDGTLMHFKHETGEILPSAVRDWALPPHARAASAR